MQQYLYIRFLFVSTLDPFAYSFADIKVKLKNRGNDPYKGDIYEDSICIEHRITSDGCRTCKIKNKTGNIMTSSQITGNIRNRTFSYIFRCSIFRSCHFHKEGRVNSYTGPFRHPGTFGGGKKVEVKISAHMTCMLLSAIFQLLLSNYFKI